MRVECTSNGGIKLQLSAENKIEQAFLDAFTEACSRSNPPRVRGEKRGESADLVITAESVKTEPKAEREKANVE